MYSFVTKFKTRLDSPLYAFIAPIKQLLLSISLSGYAQIQTPAPSTFCKIEQKFGLGTITIEYSRPSMKRRKVFGELVDFNTLWRTGANKATKITFTDDVFVEGKSLPKGSYALYSIPGELSWDLIFYSDWDQSGTPCISRRSNAAARDGSAQS